MANNLETGKKVLTVSMLAEGNSIRSIERVTEIHRDTILAHDSPTRTPKRMSEKRNSN